MVTVLYWVVSFVEQNWLRKNTHVWKGGDTAKDYNTNNLLFIYLLMYLFIDSLSQPVALFNLLVPELFFFNFSTPCI